MIKGVEETCWRRGKWYEEMEEEEMRGGEEKRVNGEEKMIKGVQKIVNDEKMAEESDEEMEARRSR